MNNVKEKAKISWFGLNEYTMAINYNDGKGIALDPIFPKFIYNWFGRLNYSIFELKPSFDVTNGRRKTMYTIRSSSANANLSSSILMTNLLVEEINARAECSSSTVTIEEINERRESDPDFIDSLETQLINDIIMDFHPTSVQNRHFMTHIVARFFQVKPAEEPWLSSDLVNKISLSGQGQLVSTGEKSEPFAFDSDKLFFIEYQASEKQFNEGSGRTIIEAVDATKFNRLSRARRVVRFIRP